MLLHYFGKQKSSNLLSVTKDTTKAVVHAVPNVQQMQFLFVNVMHLTTNKLAAR